MRGVQCDVVQLCTKAREEKNRLRNNAIREMLWENKLRNFLKCKGGQEF